MVDLSAQCDRDKRCCRVCTSPVGTQSKLCCRKKERPCLKDSVRTELMPLYQRRSQVDNQRNNHVGIKSNTVSSTILEDTACSGYHHNNAPVCSHSLLSEGLSEGGSAPLMDLSAPLVDLSAQFVAALLKLLQGV